MQILQWLLLRHSVMLQNSWELALNSHQSEIEIHMGRPESHVLTHIAQCELPWLHSCHCPVRRTLLSLRFIQLPTIPVTFTELPCVHPTDILNPTSLLAMGSLRGKEEYGPRSDQSRGIDQDMQISWGTSGDLRFYHKSVLKTQWNRWSIVRAGLKFTDIPSWDLITKLETNTQELIHKTCKSGSR